MRNEEGEVKRSSTVHSFLIYSFLICSLLTLPGEPTPPMATLVFVGDVMLGRGVAQALDGDWGAAFAGVQPWLAEADLAFANLESPLAAVPPPLNPPRWGGRDRHPPHWGGRDRHPPRWGGRDRHPPRWGGQEGGTYDLRAPREAAAALRAAGFDVVSLANNHALDAGEAGLQETVNTLRTSGIVSAGNWEPGILLDWDAASSLNHLRIYPFTHLPTYRLLAFDDSVAPLDVDAAARAVASVAERAGLVVVSIHWGAEYQAGPTLRQRAIARELARAGADLIAGHGPHVPQRVEWVGQTLVAYSLGNFLFDQPYPADCRWGAILRITVQRDRIVAVEAFPTVAERGRVKPAGPQAAAAILIRLQLPTSNL